MKQLDLKPVGLTDRMEHNATAANFAQIEDAVNSNAITAEEMYAELNGKLAAEANARKAGDDSEARDRRAADQALEDKISQSEDRLNERITAIERILFGESPQEVKMADNSTPPLANGGAMIINLTSKEDK
ncbi:MAG: hypothetical protein Q4B24_00930 [Limosilactobacillus ingluviei]|nr:hypothetical protein [Limosilactobacillus ingluviei]